jgi:hypothetical protein
MSAAKQPDKLVIATHHAQSNPRIEITPTVPQYRQLCRDLARLRSQGAPSNTAAILNAVHVAADAPILGDSRRQTQGKQSGARVGG